MRAILLCAGIGERLRPLTNYWPKCLMPILGRPLLSYWLDLLADSEFDRILVNTHHLPDEVRAFILSHPLHKKIEITYEKKLLGTGGTVFKNRNFCEGHTTLLAHADNLSLFSIKDFISVHQSRPIGCEMTMMTFNTTAPQSCGIVDLDDQKRVRGFFEKVKNPPGALANGAVYLFENSILKFLEGLRKEEIDFSTEVIPRFLGQISTFHNNIYHRDIGTVESLMTAQSEFSSVLESKEGKNVKSVHLDAGGMTGSSWKRVLDEVSN